jgi:hypothetical protein
MKILFAVTLILILTLAIPAHAGPKGEKEELRVRVVVELKDGSRLVGAPLAKSLPVTLDFMKAAIPLDKIRSCEIRHKDERVVLNLLNGDRLTGTLELSEFKMETIFGKLSPEIAQINRMTFSTWREGNMPAGEGSIFFGGVNWQPWRTLFEIRDDKLMSLPRARPGFNYGHNGNGRSPLLMSNIGSEDWRDYRVEFEYCVTGVDPSFNPYGLGSDYHDGCFLFHVADAKENWNECGSSGYNFAIGGDGAWTLTCGYNEYCATPIGWGNMRNDGKRTLASGRGLKIDRTNGNKYRLEVRGQRIQIWVDGEHVVDVTDEKMDEMIGGKTLDHGGVGFLWGYDAMGWIRNFSATGI